MLVSLVEPGLLALYTAHPRVWRRNENCEGILLLTLCHHGCEI